TASQCWPAAMRTWTSAGVDSIISMPLVAMRTTVPGKPSSATNMFDPPASTSSGVLAVSVSAMAVISCSSVEATTQVVAGRPTRAVVWFASKFSGIRLELHHRSSSSEYSSIVVMGVSYREVNAHYVSLVIDVCDSCGNFQLCPWVGIIDRSSRVSCMCGLFYRNHRRKPSLVIDDGAMIIDPLSYQIHRERHAERTMGNHPVQVGLLCGRIRPVNRIKCLRSSGISDEVCTVNVDGSGGDNFAFAEMFNSRHENSPYPRISNVEMTVATGARLALEISVCVVISLLPASSLTEVTVS